jgi:hypothetical protein
MFTGWVSGDDLDGIERLYRASTPADQAVLRLVIAPQIGDLFSAGQRARLRSMLAGP